MIRFTVPARWRFLTVVVALAVLVVLASSCVGEITPLGVTEAVAVPAATVPDARGVAVCLDPSGSMEDIAPGVAETLQDQVAELVAQSVPTGDPQWDEGFSGTPALELRLRTLLSGSSLGPAGEVLAVSVPGIPSVIGQPQPETEGYSDLLMAWTAQSEAAEEALAVARRAAEQGAEAVRMASLPGQGSEMAGCVAAAATTLRDLDVPERLVILASDLVMSQEPEVPTGAFADVEVLVVHVCDDGERCDEQQRLWTDLLGADGVEPRWLAPEAFTPRTALRS